ncbi:MAG: hypothetical protein II304_05940 [Bacteroidales bacterium]|nr:hypothetical protein [Bacteroidales bacterium]
MFSYSVITTISQVVSQFDDEDAFRRYLECNCVDIEKDLTEENINIILDKWPEFFNDVNVELNDGEEKEVLKPNLQLDDPHYEVTFNFGE